MKKNSIVQFVCFQTELELNTFIVSWEQYSKSLGKDVDVLLHQQQSGKKKFKYVSRHTSAQDDFRFVFVKGKKPEHFVDYSVRVIQAGGYIPLQIESVRDAGRKESKVLVFLNQEIDAEQFKKLELYEDLNIYQAYFESTAYSYILEYFVTDKLVENFLVQLKTLCNDDEIGVYKECALQEA
ncbi:MAG: hypothetical protein ACXWCZ_06505 [Flavisolibacter sp.]